MKTNTEKRIVNPEPYEVEETTYECEVPGCGFETENDEHARMHHGEKHALKETKDIGGETFYRFDSKEDALAWWDHFADSNSCTDKPTGITGPGWYTGCSAEPSDLPRAAGSRSASCCSDYWQSALLAAAGSNSKTSLTSTPTGSPVTRTRGSASRHCARS